MGEKNHPFLTFLDPPLGRLKWPEWPFFCQNGHFRPKWPVLAGTAKTTHFDPGNQSKLVENREKSRFSTSRPRHSGGFSTLSG